MAYLFGNNESPQNHCHGMQYIPNKRRIWIERLAAWRAITQRVEIDWQAPSQIVWFLGII